ncbi:MAG TPA: ABC transporter permease [Gemmatimonadaceae bacterium]|nr:ABC transporter permease [Gemmatimonadaceae bacterium]
MNGRLLNWGRVREMLRKEFRQMLRDARARRMLFVAPILQLIVFGYAVNTDVRNAATMVVDHDQTVESRALVDALTASGYFRVAARAADSRDLVNALDHGNVLVGLEIPEGFSKDLAAGRQASVQLLVDGTTANTANVALGYATQIIGRWGLAHGGGVAAQALRTGGAGVDFRVRAWYNENLESRVYNVPAVIGTIVLLMTLLLTSLAVVREREIGTLEQLMVSPLRPVELIIGKTLPAVTVAFIDLALITTISLLWFDIPFRGSAPFLLVASLAYILTGLGLGLFISTVSNTQQEAFMSMFFFFLPAIMLSGFMFPIANMPAALQYLTYLDPLRYYLEIVRGVFLRGAGWRILYPQALVLLGIGVLVLGLATRQFRKTTA